MAEKSGHHDAGAWPVSALATHKTIPLRPKTSCSKAFCSPPSISVESHSTLCAYVRIHRSKQTNKTQKCFL